MMIFTIEKHPMQNPQFWKTRLNIPGITILQYYLIFNFDAVGKLKDPISTTVEILNQHLTIKEGLENKYLQQ